MYILELMYLSINILKPVEISPLRGRDPSLVEKVNHV